MLHQQNELIGARYKIIALQNERSWYRYIDIATYTAFDVHESRSVVIIVYSVERAIDWKAVKFLFQRQANILLSLDCLSIPRYLGYFEIDNIDTDRKCHFYLVCESVGGKSLAELVAGGWHPNETEVKKLGIQLLDALNYLHSQSIIHQDIKPENIIFSEKNRVYLVNYGGIEAKFKYARKKDILFDNGGVVIKRLIYEPMEFAIGRPVPASDLYSVGYCLIFLLTGKSPAEFPLSPSSNEIDLTTQIDVSPDFRRWLTKMIKQNSQNRFESAAAAIRAMPIRWQADSLKLMSYRLIKHKLAISHRLN